jgi:hypothetical protein
MITPIQVKLGIFALDQIAKFTELYLNSNKNPGMTSEEADALVAQTQADTVRISDGWRASREE